MNKVISPKTDAVKDNQSERGATMLEYALMAALIAVVCISAVTLLGRNASTAFSKVGSAVN
ncbi:MAG: Flp family type IVb pilin [Bdellovibrionota bacterium]